jgi:plastocyanin
MIRHNRNAAAGPAAAALCALLVGPMQLGIATSALAASASHTVVMEGVAFMPNVLTVAQGDTVVWVNKDAFPHTATAQDKSFDSKEIAAGKSWRFTAKKTGKFAYVCTLHPTMKGTLVVK